MHRLLTHMAATALVLSVAMIPAAALAEEPGKAAAAHGMGGAMAGQKMPGDMPAGAPHGMGMGMGGMSMADRSFGIMDLNKDGVITMDEYKAFFEKLDTNKDGKVDKAEWQAGHKAPAGGGMGGGMGGSKFPAFKEMDANNDGMIDKQEYDAKFPGQGGFELVDTDKNGKLDAKEWDGFLNAHKGPMGK